MNTVISDKVYSNTQLETIMRRFMFGALLLISVAGCIKTSYKQGTEVSQKQLAAFTKGETTKEEVIEALGGPQDLKIGGGKQILIYRFTKIRAYGSNTSADTTFIFSEKGILEDILRSEPERAKKKNQSRRSSEDRESTSETETPNAPEDPEGEVTNQTPQIAVEDRAETAAVNPVESASAEVIATSANLRSGPGKHFEVAGRVHKGEQLIVVARDVSNEWFLIETQTGQRAWVFTQIVALLPAGASVPVWNGIVPPSKQP